MVPFWAVPMERKGERHTQRQPSFQNEIGAEPYFFPVFENPYVKSANHFISIQGQNTQFALEFLKSFRALPLF